MCKKLLILTSFVFMLGLVGNAVGQPTGEFLFEHWMDIGGVNVEDLTGNERYPDNPDDFELRPSFEAAVDWADNYGTRARGFLYPPEDGDYTFWISGDDFIHLYLSTDDDPANSVLIAEVPGWTSHLEWDKYPEQQSVPITLVGGQKYYIEGIVKEAGGGDSLTAGWTGPGIGTELTIIDGAFLSPADPAPGLFKAKAVVPADGAVDADVTALEWAAGFGAVSHKVYLSTDETIDDADLLGETDLTLQVAVLDTGVAYYWRVDEVDADGNVVEGDVWSFTTIPLEAHFPSPDDGATWQPLDAQLSWTAGKVVIMHDVYFGEDEAAIAARDMTTFKGKLMTESYDPGALASDTTYYWAVDQFTPTGTVAGPVWSFTTLDTDIATDPAPGDGETDVGGTPTLSWMAGETATQHDVYLSKDEALVAAGDASVLLGQQAETSLALTEALGRGTTWYWKVDVTTADGKIHLGFVNSFTIADQNTDNWAAAVAGASYLDTFVKDGLYDIGTYGGEQTYEFIVKSNPDETEASMALIGRRQFGDTQAGLKYEQWNNTGTYGATLFGVVDLDYGVATSPGEYTHLAFVSSEAAGTTDLYVNGALEGSVDRTISLSGLVGIGYGAQGEDGSGSFDNFDGDIFGVAIYDAALSAEEIAASADKYFNPIPITDPDLLIYYDFESGKGTTALDRSGHGNHGQFMGTPEWATGKFGGAVSIVREDVDYIETAPLNIVSNNVSVTGWVYHDESPEPWSGILTHRGTDPGSLGLQHNGTELRYMWGADVYWSFSSGLEIPNGEWYFAALTISPDQGKLYLNGVEQTVTNVAPHEPTNFDSVIYVGADIGNSTGRVQTSLIDEVRFYNKTLSDADIQKLLISTDADAQALVLADVTAPGDVVRGVPDDGDWPGAEPPPFAIDDDTGTKYLHFKGEVQPTGFQIEPATGPTIVTGLTLTTANDSPNRDPASFELSGSNDSLDGPYELIAAGDIADFAMADEWPRFTRNARAISFDNTTAYAYYQVMFPTVRDAGSANSMQIAEVELLHVPGPPQPVGHWPLDGDAVDISGNGNDGILMGDPQFVAGVIGDAVELDGDGDFIDCGNAELLDITGPITVACWIKVDVFDKSWQAIVTHGDSSWRVHRSGSSDNIAWGTSGASPADITGTTNVNDAEWHHIAGVYDGAQKLLYIDGAVDASADFDGSINSATHSVNIGENNQATGRYFAGLIDDVRIYNQALSEAQIGKLLGGGVKINFQQTGGDVPEGYLPDGGEVFGDRGNGYSYGWNMDSTGGARNRNNPDATDERYDTTNHLEKGEHRIWEIELPNGTYDLLVACGDVNHTDQINNMDIEGTVMLDPDGEDNFDEYALTVEVTDGRLTIQMAEGASNAKIMFVDIN
ncbi:MAG: LamG-like jellyroll fold domain-containing protein [Planctomycetota bacterium]